MKKQFDSGIFLSLVIILSVVVFLAGCSKKNNSSIIGTWVPGTVTAITQVNHVTTNDTSFVLTPALLGASSITFSSNGQYSEVLYPGGADSTGNYTYTGGILTFTSAGQGSSQPVSINGNTLTVSGGTDTTSTSPIATTQSTFTLTRQ